MRHLARLAVLFWLIAMPFYAHASCQFERGNRTSDVNFNFGTPSITIDPNAPVGSVLATVPPIAPSPTSIMDCFNNTSGGVVNRASSGAVLNGNVYPTDVPGVGIRIGHPDASNYLVPYPKDSIAGSFLGTQVTLSVMSSLELIKTGTIANGAVLGNVRTLAVWQFDGASAPFVVENFNLVAPVTLVYPSCSVNTKTINVTLPTISTTALNGVGSTGGATAFNIGLSCASGSKLLIEFDTSTPSSVATSVINNSSAPGNAKNVGVQLIDSSFNPIVFGTPALVGATPNGPLNLTYYARYYQTATSPTSGTVSATATFTLSYQ